MGEATQLYALFLFLGCLGVHALAGVIHRWANAPSWQQRTLRGAIEVIYALVHPVLYLVVLQPAMLRQVSPPQLVAVEWTLLFTYWGLRLFGAASAEAHETARRCFRAVLALCSTAVILLMCRDALICICRSIPEAAGLLFWAPLVGPLYAVPHSIAYTQWLDSQERETWHRRNLLIRSPVLARGLAAIALGLAIVFVTVAARRTPEAAIDASLTEQREVIRRAAKDYRVDPRLLAALIVVTQREYTTPFRAALEQGVAAAWLTDPTSHFHISAALDPSLGVSQIKVDTLLTARFIWERSGMPKYFGSKEERDVPGFGDAIQRIPRPALADIAPPGWLAHGNKEDLVRALLTPERNIEACAFLLDLYARQWEAADPDWSIRDRPEILATLFQLGFQRSLPKPAPRANTFGREVAEAMHEKWINDLL